MSVIADKTSHGFARLTIDGQVFLGVKVSGHKRSMAGQLQSLRRGHGWIVTGDRMESWELSGLIEHEGAIYAYGPYLENSPLDELFSMESAQALELVSALVSALLTLGARSAAPSKFDPALILSLRQGGLLFLPDEIIDGVIASQTVQERVETFDTFNHPDLKGERNACFLIGVLMYRVLTGKLPYTAGSSEEIHERMRQLKILPPHLAVPEVNEGLSQLIVRSFDPEQQVTLEEWQEELARCRREGLLRTLADGERTRIREAAERFRKSSEAGYRRKVFFRKNWKTIAIAAGIVVVVGAVGGSILKNALKPRITVGMAPAQVVHLFYTSMNSFNSQAMEDCVIDGAGKAAISEATNLYVITRVREGYQGTSGYVSAQQWLDAGKPKLKSGMSVYGVADLKLNEDTPGVYTVNYQKWEPYQPANEQPPTASTAPVLMKIQGFKREDKVYLKNEGKFWAIYRIDRLVNEKIGGPVTVTNPALPSGPRTP